jgi:hypothetical protein
MTICTLALTLFCGCSEPVGERKKPVALDQVPDKILKLAQQQHPDLVIESAFREVEDGKPVYEFKAKSKSGKIIEVEVTEDGKILK